MLSCKASRNETIEKLPILEYRRGQNFSAWAWLGAIEVEVEVENY